MISTTTTKRALIGPSATAIVLRYEVVEIVSTRSQPGTHGATRSGSLMKSQTRSIGAGIVKRSSIFISETKTKGKNRHICCHRSRPYNNLATVFPVARSRDQPRDAPGHGVPAPGAGITFQVASRPRL